MHLLNYHMLRTYLADYILMHLHLLLLPLRNLYRMIYLVHFAIDY